MSKQKAKGRRQKAENETPNLMFIGRDGKRPLVSIRDGQTEIILPSVSAQASPFYHAEAARIVRLYPHYYKYLVAKGK
jgi:hypothetical protein